MSLIQPSLGQYLVVRTTLGEVRDCLLFRKLYADGLYRRYSWNPSGRDYSYSDVHTHSISSQRS